MLSYIRLIYMGYKYYKNNDIIKDKNFQDSLKTTINNCGLYAIKATQLIIPYIDLLEYVDKDTLNYIRNEFNIYFDMCNVHDLEYTKSLYINDFKEDIYDKYSINEIVGSGSVAQVYKITCKKTNKIYAMKVVHPRNKYYKYIIYLIYKICHALKFNKLNIDIYKFVKSIDSQYNLINEVNNLLEFKSIYESDIIKAPNIIKFSNNIIIMEYIERTEVSDILKETMATIIHNIQYYYDWFHGDLHFGNMIYNNDILYIIDFSSSYNTNFSLSVLRSIHYNVSYEFYLYSLNICDPNLDKKIIDEFKTIFIGVDGLQKNECFKHKVMCRKFVDFCINKNIIIDERVINVIFNVLHYEYIVKSTFNDLIIMAYEICDKHNIYREYFEHIKRDIKNNIIDRQEKYKNLENLIKFD